MVLQNPKLSSSISSVILVMFKRPLSQQRAYPITNANAAASYGNYRGCLNVQVAILAFSGKKNAA
jgi:hypothetical protein